jgi:hypothetical protein
MAENQPTQWTITVRYVPSDAWLVLTGICPASTVRRLKQHALERFRLAPSSNSSSFAPLSRSVTGSPVIGGRPATAGGVSTGNNGNLFHAAMGASWGRDRGTKGSVSQTLILLLLYSFPTLDR